MKYKSTKELGMSVSKSINWHNFKSQLHTYGKEGPFDHVVIDDFFETDFANALANEFPDINSEIWHGYDNPLEVKFTNNIWNFFPEKTYKLFSYLNSDAFLTYLSQNLLGGTKLYSDPGLNGGGWHVHKAGGKLNTHLDYSLHPKLSLQRKLNIIIYMNPNWQKDWGGALGFWDNKNAECPGDLIKSVWSKFNRAVIFDTTQNSWHGLPDELKCPEEETRKSLAAYFLCDPPAAIDPRGKALYAPTAEQSNQQDILDLIRQRATIDGATSTYKKS